MWRTCDCPAVPATCDAHNTRKCDVCREDLGANAFLLTCSTMHRVCSAMHTAMARELVISSCGTAPIAPPSPRTNPGFETFGRCACHSMLRSWSSMMVEPSHTKNGGRGVALEHHHHHASGASWVLTGGYSNGYVTKVY